MDERLSHLARYQGSNLAPIHPHALLSLANPQPKYELSPERLITRSSRLVLLPTDAPRRVELEASAQFLGAWELPLSARLTPGVPGQNGIVLRAKPRGDQTLRRKVTIHADSHVPDWLPIGYHPTPAFYRTQSEIRTRKGGRIRQSDNHVQIFGTDDRVNIYPGNYPERCICRIEVSTRDSAGGPWIFRSRGTGFMAGSRIMMTSGHMRPPQPNAGWMIKVVPGSYDGNSLFGSSFFTFASDYAAYQSDTGDDFMACRLYDAIGDTTGWFGAISYDDDWEDLAVWSMCGYPYDIGDARPTYQGAIAVIDDDDGDDIELPNGADFDTTQIESYADEASGASGSPLYSWFTDGNMYAVGVHHGRETDSELFGSDTHSVASGGDGFVALVVWARENWQKENIGTIAMG